MSAKSPITMLWLKDIHVTSQCESGYALISNIDTAHAILQWLIAQSIPYLYFIADGRVWEVEMAGLFMVMIPDNNSIILNKLKKRASLVIERDLECDEQDRPSYNWIQNLEDVWIMTHEQHDAIVDSFDHPEMFNGIQMPLALFA